MNYRTAQVLALTDLATSGTKLVDINLTDPISALLINYEITVGAGNRLKHISSLFDKIEIIDGSDILVSLKGSQMKALEYFLHDEMAEESVSWTQSVTNYGKMSYQFGRHLWDEELAFDPTRFRNPQIRLQWDVANVEANATDADVEIYAQVFDEKGIAPTGFLQTKVLQAYTPSADAWEYVNLPRDYPYRGIWVQGYSRGDGLPAYFSQFKLTEDVDKRVPYDLDVHDIIYENARQFGDVLEVIGGSGQSADTAAAALAAYNAKVTMAASDVGNVTNVSVAGGGHIRVITGANSDTKVYLHHSGLVPAGMIMFPVCDLDEIGEFWDVRGLNNLQLQIKAGGLPASPSDINVVIQQLRS